MPIDFTCGTSQFTLEHPFKKEKKTRMKILAEYKTKNRVTRNVSPADRK
jgi:hypothetical protein